ncbi:MAG: Stk1 family PASTA domain-containing Ser/Thr kinase [Clostridiaceae bacterium]
MAFEILNNRYEIIEKIGEGGMAIVYKAKDSLLNRYVAIKILKDEFAINKEFLGKFKREATAAASLSDINIVNIYDIGSDKDVNYIVMEYIKGKTLKQIIKENGLIPQDKAIKIAIQIAKALDCAHSHGIIHRDIKPHNIMINENGLVKVTDFGIAKAASSYTLTNTKEVIGSAHYFSPEQARGSFVDFRTDIYSLGIVMYEMVTGSLPYDGDSPVSIALKHLQEKVIEPKFLKEELSDGLNNLILKSIQKDPAYRYTNVKEMISDLKKLDLDPDTLIRFNNDSLDQTRVMEPISIEDEIKKPNKNKNRKKITIIILSLLIVLLGVFLTIKFVFYGNSNKNMVQVPNVLGMDKDTAQAEIEKAGLVFVLDSKISSDYETDKVAKTSPDAGASLNKGSEVKVNLSDGKAEATVPDVKNLYIDSAKEILKNYGFAAGEITYQYSDTIAANNVISQSIDAKSQAPKGSTVDLVVSKGEDITVIKVPKLISKTLDDAKASIETIGLTLGKAESLNTSDKSLDKIVYSQDIPENTEVAKGQTINITYYTYKVTTVKVLNFVKKTYGIIKDDQMQTMLDQGLSFKFIDENGNQLDPDKNEIPDTATVTDQTPPANTQAAPDTLITLTLKTK